MLLKLALGTMFVLAGVLGWTLALLKLHRVWERSQDVTVRETL